MKRFFIGLGLICFILAPLLRLQSVTMLNGTQRHTSFESPLSPGLIPHEAISISNDSDFVRMGLPGNGTLENPFVIENLSIVSSERCIDIRNVRAHFAIRNCYLWHRQAYRHIGESHSDWATIFIQNTTTGIIIDNSIEGYAYGVLIKTSNNTHLSWNIIAGYIFSGEPYGAIGVGLEHDHNVTVRDCFFSFWGAEIASLECEDLTLTGNLYDTYEGRESLAPHILHDVFITVTYTQETNPSSLDFRAKVTAWSGVDTVLIFYSFDGVNYTSTKMELYQDYRYHVGIETPEYTPEHTTNLVCETETIYYYFWANDSLNHIRYTDIDEYRWSECPPSLSPSLEILIITFVVVIIGYLVWRRIH